MPGMKGLKLDFLRPSIGAKTIMAGTGTVQFIMELFLSIFTSVGTNFINTCKSLMSYQDVVSCSGEF